MQEDSIFELASVSKQFTATAIMLLRRRGLLHLEDELSKFFPENPYPGITMGRHGVELMVADEDLEAAKKILADTEAVED